VGVFEIPAERLPAEGDETEDIILKNDRPPCGTDCFEFYIAGDGDELDSSGDLNCCRFDLSIDDVVVSQNMCATGWMPDEFLNALLDGQSGEEEQDIAGAGQTCSHKRGCIIEQSSAKICQQ